ncbi:MAG TPA: hypothetical protein VFK02_17925, partial [Kofleriaceae bacterium]|nr:hypothetical protein [Kofleriaceae bacterium]
MLEDRTGSRAIESAAASERPAGSPSRGAGRKPKGPRAGESHRARPELKARHPVHVVLCTVEAVRSLRRRHTYQAIRWATL